MRRRNLEDGERLVFLEEFLKNLKKTTSRDDPFEC